MGGRAVHQLSVSAAYGDAIGNEVMQIRDALRARGYTSDVFVELVDPRMASEVRPYQEYLEVADPDNIVLLHYSIGSAVSRLAREIEDRLVLIYHNITPAHWYAPYTFTVARDCAAGRIELASLRERTALGLGDSEYNRQELEELGFEPTDVLPLLLDLSNLDGPSDPSVLARFDDDRPTWLFVGRVVPNKCFEDIIRAFAYFQHYINHRARLVIVGEHRTFAPYYDALQELADSLNVDGIHFAGHVTNAELRAYYAVADAFVCMSEHEGFCVPLFEAIHKGLPVFAFDSTAIPYSTNQGVLLFEDKDPATIAETIATVLADRATHEALLERQRRALRSVDPTRVLAALLEHIDALQSKA
ncbi:MAG: glycosyltransferase [Acidobacteria bacterium]|nr:glycosyltransferase [Acidobacteriota bacterium]